MPSMSATEEVLMTRIESRPTVLAVALLLMGAVVVLLAGPSDGPEAGNEQAYVDKSGDERTTEGACYYGEPITAKAGCLPCHGTPAGELDPYFPEYKKNGWKAGDVVGAVIARVAPEN